MPLEPADDRDAAGNVHRHRPTTNHANRVLHELAQLFLDKPSTEIALSYRPGMQAIQISAQITEPGGQRVGAQWMVNKREITDSIVPGQALASGFDRLLTIINHPTKEQKKDVKP